MKCLVCNLPFLLGIVAVVVQGEIIKDKRHHLVPIESAVDTEAEATGFSGAVQAASKYFQYTHVPSPHHYEHGHKRGNDHHFIERHEKAHPHEGEFKTKVRWGDKHGGYGEHYWDYNHAGDDDGHGDESNVQEVVQEYEIGSEKPGKKQAGAGAGNYERKKRQSAAGSRGGDVEFISDAARKLIQNGATGRHGGNYRRDPGFGRSKRHPDFGQKLLWYPLAGRSQDRAGEILVQPVDY